MAAGVHRGKLKRGAFSFESPFPLCVLCCASDELAGAPNWGAGAAAAAPAAAAAAAAGASVQKNVEKPLARRNGLSPLVHSGSVPAVCTYTPKWQGKNKENICGAILSLSEKEAKVSFQSAAVEPFCSSRHRQQTGPEVQGLQQRAEVQHTPQQQLRLQQERQQLLQQRQQLQQLQQLLLRMPQQQPNQLHIKTVTQLGDKTAACKEQQGGLSKQPTVQQQLLEAQRRVEMLQALLQQQQQQQQRHQNRALPLQAPDLLQKERSTHLQQLRQQQPLQQQHLQQLRQQQLSQHQEQQQLTQAGTWLQQNRCRPIHLHALQQKRPTAPVASPPARPQDPGCFEQSAAAAAASTAAAVYDTAARTAAAARAATAARTAAARRPEAAACAAPSCAAAAASTETAARAAAKLPAEHAAAAAAAASAAERPALGGLSFLGAASPSEPEPE
ncbi:hypothetical protein, conserved [Eimeria tenella]|uniref:Uncharacterized protein n=1 Tax=Eimeria tenella TaxID=5802 RepID=U6KJD3_EIMTE|nr:hypothetical protein, conserved [Eimeria tenella]CDJ38044.1 hypothetical protein, conserved [Eimeria tenella]|eukprot:XP_013228882.1 hypothetical protein, conserved [Eimeria tenella]